VYLSIPKAQYAKAQPIEHEITFLIARPVLLSSMLPAVNFDDQSVP
jgi:hypothetical protein